MQSFAYSRENSVVFDIDAVEKCLSDSQEKLALEWGILTEEKIESLTQLLCNFSFWHKTIQEFLACLYAAKHDDCLHVILGFISDQTQDAFEIHQIFLFLCGLKPAIAESISETVAARIPTHSTLNSPFTSYEYTVSKPNDHFIQTVQNMIIKGCKEARANKLKNGKFVLEHYTFYDWSLKDSSDAAILREIFLLNRNSIRTLVIQNNPEIPSSEEIQKALTKSGETMRSLDLCHIDGHFDLSSCRNLEYLGIRGPCTLALPDAFKRIKTLSLGTPFDIELLRRVTNDSLPNIEIFEISNIAAFSDSILNLKNLSYIAVRKSNFENVCLLLPLSIRSIDLFTVELKAATASSMVNHMTKVQHKVTLSLQNCVISDPDILEACKRAVRSSPRYNVLKDDAATFLLETTVALKSDSLL
ncbi:hypothetical protein DPMN_073909 [Dreissena polymorpha]|uniref:Uncharacterized protein n=2 Tax=Dreissena polymorpha TaxID=45954 RepID=A0A9D3YHN3_DREPO|nr:hypothetical protein DPMN_073909 [Dreissena polymorpha]